ncbi:MAG TPA: outer membrane lipoprotein chaperone LolA [Blastocatellia bacterium]|nr:outer membrane lipoprotein chaperone LolA [Blastocatellia bacterium]
MLNKARNYQKAKGKRQKAKVRFGFLFPFSFFLIFSLPLTSYASSSVAAQNELSAIIDGVQRKYSRMKGLAADFVQVYVGPDGRAARESGRVILKRPGKARWEYTSPERKTFVSDGKNIYFYVHGERHATRTGVKQSVDPQIPFLFLLGRGNLRRDFSRIELLSDEPAAGAGNRVLRLFPKRAPEEFKQLLAEVNPTTFEVRRLVIFERSGARMDFFLSNIRENYVAPDSEFQFTPPPGVTVRQQ